MIHGTKGSLITYKTQSDTLDSMTDESQMFKKQSKQMFIKAWGRVITIINEYWFNKASKRWQLIIWQAKQSHKISGPIVKILMIEAQSKGTNSIN